MTASGSAVPSAGSTYAIRMPGWLGVACTSTKASVRNPDSGCAAHDGKGHCSDALQRHECRGTTWTCPESTISTSECKCLGKPRPGCTCGDKGWVCSEPAAPK